MRIEQAATLATWLSAAAVPATASTWWVDKSCAAYWKDAVVSGDGMSSETFDKIMGEAFTAVKMGYARMTKPKGDEKAAHEIYEALFKHQAGQSLEEPAMDANEDAWNWYEFINAVWGKGRQSLQQFEKADVATGREQSDVRIYCDNDARFVELEPEDIPKGLPQSKDLYIDDINKIKINSIPSCRQNALRELDPSDPKHNLRNLAVTYGGKSGVVHAGNIYDNPFRVSMTICDYWLKKENRYDLMGALPDKKGFGKIQPHIDDLRKFTSMTMLHELHHHSSYKKSDHAYDWKPSVALDKVKAPMNADSHAMFGVAMRGLEKGFKVDVKTGDWNKPLLGGIPKTGITKRDAIGDLDIGSRFTCNGNRENITSDDLMCQEFTA